MIENEYIKVKDAEDLVKDIKSSAVLNIDNDALKAYKARKRKENNVELMLQEHEKLKEDVKEIKSLLLDLIGRK